MLFYLFIYLFIITPYTKYKLEGEIDRVNIWKE